MSANEMPVIIFAVDEGMKEIYDELSSYIQVGLGCLFGLSLLIALMSP
jgi:hypothetical protein